MGHIESLAPMYVVSLGAVSTNILLNSKEKMSAIHGNFFNLHANTWNYQMMPIFHPDFLLINPNMKRTAWMDLQKLMQLLGKI
jgi:DNA polymerase